MIVCNYVNFIGLLCVTFERRPCGRTRRTFLITKISYAAERRTLIKEIFLYLKSVKLEERHAPPWSLSAASPLMPSFTSPSCFSPSSCALWRFLASTGFARAPSLSLFAFLRSRPQSLSFPDDWPQLLVPWHLVVARNASMPIFLATRVFAMFHRLSVERFCSCQNFNSFPLFVECCASPG